MRAGKQLFLVGLALLVLAQAATARPWLPRTSLADSRLSSLQEQLRQNQLRRLRTVDGDSEYEEMTMQLSASDSDISSNSLGYGYGYGYHGYGYGYGDSLQEPAAGTTPRALLAPEVSYSTDDVVQAGAAWDPSAATIELQESGQRQQQFYEEGDEIVVGPAPAVREAGQRASQFYEEGDEIVVGPVPAVREAGQHASQFYEEGDEIVVGPVPAVREAGQRASQFYEEGDEIFRGPVPSRP